jgi:hypothetical protein
MISAIKRQLSNHLVNVSGWTTSRKIVVLESDDWGSIRMPSVAAYNNLLDAGIAVNKSPYCKYDNLCSVADLDALFSVMQKHIDSVGNNPVLTANVVVANPDFDAIKASDYQVYSYEAIDQTFARFFPNEKPLAMWKEGLDNKLFLPQFHGREHVNVALWLEKLQQKDATFLKAFEEKCWGISNDIFSTTTKSIQASFDYTRPEELVFMKESIVDGLQLFKKLFGFASESFIPNNYIWPIELNETLQQNNIRVMQGMKYQLLPKQLGETKRKKIRRYNGQLVGENNPILQTVRNVQFEPSLLPANEKDHSVSRCLEQIQTAFLWKKPAIITTHRINFCGTLSEENRVSNLKLFDQLLGEITKRWPEVEFMTTVALSKIIK